MPTTNNSMWGTHSAQRGWVLNCLKSQTQPSVYLLPSSASKSRLNSQVITWHAKSASQPKPRPKELFFLISAEGVYLVENHADYGGYKLVYQGPGYLQYMTVSPEKVPAIFLRLDAGESYAQIASNI